MRLKLKYWENRLEEIQKNAANMYETYFKNKKEYNKLQKMVIKGELVWEILYGDDTGSDYKKKVSVATQFEKLNEIKVEIDDFENKYLKAEDTRLYLDGLISADLYLLYKSYRLGNTDAGFIWGLVTLLNETDKDAVPEALRHMDPSFVRRMLMTQYETGNKHDDAMKALEKAANQKSTYSSDALLFLAEYYEIYGLTEAKDLHEAENNLKTSLKYYEKLKEIDINTYKKYKDRVKNINSVLECYDYKNRRKDKNEVKKVKNTDKRRELIAQFFFALMAMPLAIILIISFITVFKHSIELEVDYRELEMTVNIPGDTLVVGKNYISFSEKWSFCKGDLTPTKIPVKIYISSYSNSYEPKEFKVKDGVTKIYDIGNCEKITYVELPDSVVEIGDGAFGGWTSLTEVKLSSKLEKLGRGAFAGCPIESITLPENLTNIDDYAFSNCNLTKINLPENLTYIGAYAFQKNENLKSIEIPQNVSYIGEGAFQDCYKLKSVKLPDQLQEIGNGMFINCALKKITLPGELIKIGERAFENNKSLKSIKIPDKVSYIGSYAFFGCENLEKVKLSDQLAEIKESTFEDCRNLYDIRLPGSLINIGERAFNACINLKELNLPDSLESIRKQAFMSTGLQEIILPENIKIIEANAFSYTGLKSIKLPYGIEMISEENFGGLETIYVDERDYDFYNGYFNSEAKIKTKK